MFDVCAKETVNSVLEGFSGKFTCNVIFSEFRISNYMILFEIRNYYVLWADRSRKDIYYHRHNNRLQISWTYS